MERELICGRCQKKLANAHTTFTYMGHTFHAELPKCPECGQVYIDETLVRGKMADVETELEDK